MTPVGHTYPHPSGDGGTRAALALQSYPWTEGAGGYGPVIVPRTSYQQVAVGVHGARCIMQHVGQRPPPPPR